jgi:hypothetical protein
MGFFQFALPLLYPGDVGKITISLPFSAVARLKIPRSETKFELICTERKIKFFQDLVGWLVVDFERWKT